MTQQSVTYEIIDDLLTVHVRDGVSVENHGLRRAGVLQVIKQLECERDEALKQARIWRGEHATQVRWKRRGHAALDALYRETKERAATAERERDELRALANYIRTDRTPATSTLREIVEHWFHTTALWAHPAGESCVICDALNGQPS